MAVVAATDTQSSTVPVASRSLRALASAALAIPGLALSSPAQAQTMPDGATVRLQYSGYRDYQEGRENRMRIQAPMVSVETPISDRDVLEASYTFDALSGASPVYLSTLSGASGRGIEDRRRAGDFKFTHQFERCSVGAGMRASDEDDYFSRGAVVDAKTWTPDKNTTFALGFSYDSDDISSSNQPDFGDRKRSQSYFFGVTQVLNPNSIVQSNLGYTNSRGYQADPYKNFDNRPRSRGGWSWLSRYNLYFPEWESSLHADYRFFVDTWGIKSHMLEVAWYQPLGSKWLVRPSIRYYSQSSAQFFDDRYPPDDTAAFYSADQRMGDFGSLGAGLKLIRDLGRGFSADIAFEAFVQKSAFKIGGKSEAEVEDFYAGFFSVGLAKKF